MTSKFDVWFPCMSFFVVGRMTSGLCALVMQATILLWPVASRWARTINDTANVERMLAELSETHRVPVDPYAMPMKKFRQAA